MGKLIAVDIFNLIRYGAAAMRPLDTNLLLQLVTTSPIGERGVL